MPPPSTGICSAMAVMKCESETQNAHSLPCAIHCRNGHIRTIECISSLVPRIRSRHSSQAADIDPNGSRAVIHILEDSPRWHGGVQPRTTQTARRKQISFSGLGDHGTHGPPVIVREPAGSATRAMCVIRVVRVVCGSCLWLVLSVARVVRGTIWRTCAHRLSASRPS